MAGAHDEFGGGPTEPRAQANGLHGNGWPISLEVGNTNSTSKFASPTAEAMGHPTRRLRSGVLRVTVGVWLIAPIMMASVGCRLGVARYPEALTARDPKLRIRAIRAAGQRRDVQAIPLLIDRLEDEDEAVRFYAIQALRQITGSALGYLYYKPASHRGQAVDRWRRYVRDARTGRPTAEGSVRAAGNQVESTP